MSNQYVFNDRLPIAPLKIAALESCQDLAKKVNDHIVNFRRNDTEELMRRQQDLQYRGYDVDSYLLDCACPRFGSGEGKGVVRESVRGTDVFAMVDVTNHSLTYKMSGYVNHMSPDDHYADLKRLIAAMTDKPKKITVIMPFLYESRQHKRSSRESLDCAVMLQELKSYGVDNIVTFDAHDPRVVNAIQFIKTLLRTTPDLEIDNNHMMVISPDEGAMHRAIYFANLLGVDVGMFYKRRDYSRVVDGRNPIVAHEFLGDSVEGKDVIIIDDMIASGESMIDVARQLKQRKAKRVYCIATFGLFTKGLEVFDKCHEEGLIEKVITTNLTYQMPDLFKKDWYESADMSKYIALIIDHLNHDASISELLDPAERINARIAEYKEKHTISDNYEM